MFTSVLTLVVQHLVLVIQKQTSQDKSALALPFVEFAFVTQIVKKLIFNPEGIQKFVFQALAQHWSNKLPGAGGSIWHTTFESLHDYHG